MPRWGSRFVAPVFDVSTRWGWVVSTTPRPFYPAEGDSVPIAEEARMSVGGFRSTGFIDTLPSR
jgi:hypothetical protein